MLTQGKVLRWIKILLVATAALYFTLIALNNLLDYNTNFQFVKHVLLMDTTFPDNPLQWRAFESSTIWHVFYWIIIIWEIITAVFLWTGTAVMIKNRKARDSVFNKSKKYSILGMGIGLLLWFFAFVTIGGEWFTMWQSSTWNGLDAAFRMFGIMGIVFVVLILNDEEQNIIDKELNK